MASNRAKYSQRGQNRGTRVDVDALSPVARRRIRELHPGPRTTPFTASTTQKHNFGAAGFAGIVKAAYISTAVLPNIATSATVRLVAYDASANTEINLSDAFDVEDSTTTLVAREPGAMTLATTNVAIEANDSLELHLIAGGAVTTNATDLVVVIIYEPTEDTVVSD